MDSTILYNFYRSFSDIFWSKRFWLPQNTTWADLERTETTYFPHSTDLWIPIPIAILLFAIRLLWERFIALPIGQMYGLKNSVNKKPPHNQVLQELFKTNKKVFPLDKKIKELEVELGMERREIERWWKKRRVQGKPSELQRFKESSWRFVFYLVAFGSGVYFQWDKVWVWDTKHCFIGYPFQPVDEVLWYYYMIELGFYWSLMMSLFMDTWRKDFTETIIHHLVTISLLSMSYSANLIRIGGLIMCLHDAIDPIMELAKMANYCKYKKVTNFLFICFTVMWFITRICIYPFYILKNTIFEATKHTGMAYIYYAYNGLLCVLQVLHIIWFCFILKMAYYYVIKGQVEKDARSDTEPDSESGGENNNNNNNKNK